eukprot:gene8490-314_t
MFIKSSIEIPEISLVILNSKVWIQEEEEYKEAIAIGTDGKIFKIGTSKEIEKLILKNTEIIDGENKMFISPGFIDTHCHLLSGSRLYYQGIVLQNISSINEFKYKLREYIKKQEENKWIQGGRWDHFEWGGTLPNKSWIDSFGSNNPIYLVRKDGHQALVNSIALKLGNITKYTKNPDGGEIERNENGELTGILKENAMNLISKLIPIDEKEDEISIIKSMNHLLKNGITFINDLSSSLTFNIYKKLNKEDKLKIRIRSAFEIKQVEQLIEEMKHFKNNDYLTIGILKGMVDGALGSMTAKMYQPYKNTNNTGIIVTNQTILYKFGKIADDHNLQVVIHAIGDEGNGMVLNVFEKILKENGLKDRRFRIEHAQQLKLNDLKRFKKLNVSASMQPYHLIEDSEYAEQLIGDRFKNLFLFKSILKEGIKLSFGADWPISPISPIESIYAAVTRKTKKYPNGFNIDESISIEDALKSYTSTASFLSFTENKIGKIKNNYFADLVILDRDILNLNDNDEIKNFYIKMKK